MAKGRPHVVPRDNGWAVKREGADRASSTHRTQSGAISGAPKIARAERTESVIHGRDNLIRDSDSYGGDPFPPRDKKH